MNTSLEMILDIGVDEIAAHLQRVQEPLLDLAARRDIPITSPRGAHGSAIVCLKAPGRREAPRRAPRSNEVICSLREGSLRFSPHLFNSVDDVARARRCWKVLEGPRVVRARSVRAKPNTAPLTLRTTSIA